MTATNLPANVNINILNGDAFTWIVTLLDANGDPLGGIGSTWECAIHDSGGLVETIGVSQASNVLTLSLTDTQTSGLSLTRHRYFWFLKDLDNDKTYVGGAVTVSFVSPHGINGANGNDITVRASGNTINVSTNVQGSGGVGDMLIATYDPAGISEQVIGISDTVSSLAAEAPVTVTGTTDTLAAGDYAKTNIYNNAALVTVTLPTDAGDNLDIGFWTCLFAAGAGGVTLSTAGLTLVGNSPNTTIAQNEGMVVMKTAADTWMVVGATS